MSYKKSVCEITLINCYKINFKYTVNIHGRVYKQSN